MKARTKQRLKRVWKVWRALTVLLLSAVLIPLFVAGQSHVNFYSGIIVPSILLYLVLTYVHLRLPKGNGVQRYLESTATRLLAGLVSLAITFILFGTGLYVWASTMVVVSAVCYAFFLQRVAFLRVIGL